MTVIAGPDQIREPRPPLPISGIPSSTVPSSRNCCSLWTGPSHVIAAQPRDRDVAVGVVQRS